MQVDQFLRRVAQLRADVCELEEAAKELGRNPDPERDVDYINETYGIGRDTITRAEREGKLSVARRVRNKIWVKQSELDRWLADRDAWARKPVRRAKPRERNEWADDEAAELAKLDRLARGAK